MNLMVPELRGILARWGIYLAGLLLAAAATSCNTTKYLAYDEELLVSQRVELRDAKSVDDRANVAYELSTLAKQQPNGNFLFLFPREHFYFANNKPRDTTRLDRFLRTEIGQEPTLYSDSLSRRSAGSMADYLRYLGYFNANVYHEADRRKAGKVNLIYHVEAGRRFLIDSVVYSSPDAGIDSLLRVAMEDSELRQGTPLDLNGFDKEKSRISRFLRDQGYTFFSNSYFDKLEIDTTRRSGYADIFLSVLPAQRQGAYRPYRIGSVTVLTDYQATTSQGQPVIRRDSTVMGIRFLTGRESFRMRPDILAKNIFLRPGEMFSQEHYDQTNLSLGALNIYRFVRINQQVDSLEEGVLNYLIQLSPDKSMAFGVDVDVNYVNRRGTTLARNLIGLSVSPNFQDRNVLGGAELLVASLRGGVELNPSIKSGGVSLFQTANIGADISLSLPRFKDFGGYRLLRGLGLLSPEFYTRLRQRASTRYSLSYEYQLIRRFYAYTLAEARFGYDLQRSPTTSYRINHTAIDILNPQTERGFDELLATNPFLRLSFGNQYFLSGLFRDVTYTRVGRTDRRGRSLTLTGQFELAGAELFLANTIANELQDKNITWTPRPDATYAKYFLALADARYTKRFTPTTSFATRLLFAVGRPFGQADAVPYVKQFYAGGANSMRAWQPRGLGPGGYVDALSLSANNNLFLFQAGDLRAELNLEYRYNLFWQVRGAFFADIGNIWTISNDPSRPGSQFRFVKGLEGDGGNQIITQPFYRQIAIGGGTGFRVDLSYFVFRLDAAIPIRYNYPQDGSGLPLDRNQLEFSSGNYWRSFSSFGFREINWQLGLGYPF